MRHPQHPQTVGNVVKVLEAGENPSQERDGVTRWQLVPPLGSFTGHAPCGHSMGMGATWLPVRPGLPAGAPGLTPVGTSSSLPPVWDPRAESRGARARALHLPPSQGAPPSPAPGCSGPAAPGARLGVPRSRPTPRRGPPRRQRRLGATRPGPGRGPGVGSTVRRVTGRPAPPPAAAATGARRGRPAGSGVWDDRAPGGRYLVRGHRAEALEDGQDVLLAGVPHGLQRVRCSRRRQPGSAEQQRLPPPGGRGRPRGRGRA